jgi:alpha,alpha-trehalase
MKDQSPEIVFAELFRDLHLEPVLDDGKLITDALPKGDPEIILKTYRQTRSNPNFNLKSFFENHFEIPETSDTGFKTDRDKSLSEHIESLWEVLSRKSLQPVAGSSALPLPYSYIVPGGRFNEIYYWDSYFTMLGLRVSGRIDLIRNMIENFSFMIREYGCIPNGNRTYFLGRSQPPFFAMMVELLAEIEGDQVYLDYLDVLHKEYRFWMEQDHELSMTGDSSNHVVFLNGKKLNRYYDENTTPRPEMFGADYYLAESVHGKPEELFANLRAACESGWDFSSRWLDDDLNLSSIHCLDILPVDLNCLICKLESVLAHAFKLNNDNDQSELHKYLASQRAQQIKELFWDGENQYFMDYNFRQGRLTSVRSLAGVFPLYFNLASETQAKHVAHLLETEFLEEGGLSTTTIDSGQQWDAPNGWAPLQWMAVCGLRNYGFNELADRVAESWLNLNEKVFKDTGKMLEKYNVRDVTLISGGGEYPVQDGFGWTNGVALALLQQVR